MSERLAALGRLGAEELADVLNMLFSALLSDAAAYGGSLLKYGGDAVLLFFEGDDHAARGAAATHRMRATLRRLGTVKTSRGTVRVRMSVGIHSGEFDFFLVGDSHRELIVAGPGATETVEMESAAEAGDILLSPSTASLLAPSCVGEQKAGGFLLKRIPRVEALRDFAWGQVPDSDPAPFVPVGLRNHLGGVGADAEHRHVAVGFVAFGGVDDLLAADGGDYAAEVLDRFIRSCQSAFERFDVCFLYADVYDNGGKVFFLAGAPVSHEDNEERLLRAALEISGVRHDRLFLHTGLNRGYVFAGDIGATFRRTYTVLGDAVNTAARVMASCNEDNQVRTMPEVLELASSRFGTEAQPPFTAKGKALPLSTFAVGEPLGPRLADTPLPLIGRDDELGRLNARLQAAVEGRGGLVHVAGEAGIGKTRLVQELVEHANAEGFATVTTFAERYEQSTPYFVYRQLLQIIFDGAENDESKLLSVARALAPAHEKWFPLLGRVLALDLGSTPETEALGDDAVPPALGRLTIALLDGFLDGPSLWVAENAHLVDAASAGVIETVTAEIGRRPWVLMAVRRSEEPTGLTSLPGDTYELGPLAVEAGIRLARTANVTLLPHDAASISERSGGNPLFLRQLVSVSGEGGELADSVETAVSARIDRLSPRDREVLRTASVLGGRFEAGALRELLGGRAADLAPLQDFLTVTDTGVIFKQALYREVAYAGLTFRRRRALHLAAGRLLEAENRDDPMRASRLSLHFDAAQAWDLSWKYSTIAAEHALLGMAKPVAANFYVRALTAGRHLGQEPEVLAEYAGNAGQAWFHAGRIDAARRIYALGRRLAPANSVVMADLELREAVLRHGAGDVKRATAWFVRGIKTLEASGADLTNRETAEVAVSLFAGLGDCRLRLGKVSDARQLADRAMGVAEASGKSELIARTYDLLTFIAAATGDYEAARTFEQAALDIHRSNPVERGSMATVGMNLGAINHVLGDWKTAAELWEEAHTVFLEVGNDSLAAVNQVNLVELFLNQGRWSDAESMLDEVEPVLQVIEDEAYQFALALRSLLATRRGVPSETCLSDAGTAIGLDDILLSVRVETALTRGDGQAALSALDASDERAGFNAVAELAARHVAGVDTLPALRALADDADGDVVAAAVAQRLLGPKAPSTTEATRLGIVDVPVWAKRIYCPIDERI